MLERHWNTEDTVILCGDEMVLTSRTTTQRVWLPIGEYPPVIESNSTRKHQNFYRFLNLKTGREDAFLTEKQNMNVTAEVLTQLRGIYPTQNLILLCDNCGWHKGAKVIEWIEADGKTEVMAFPPYTPDLNPQEHVWKAGRKAVIHNHHIHTIEEIADSFISYLQGQTFPYALLGFRSSGGAVS